MFYEIGEYIKNRRDRTIITDRTIRKLQINPTGIRSNNIGDNAIYSNEKEWYRLAKRPMPFWIITQHYNVIEHGKMNYGRL